MDISLYEYRDLILSHESMYIQYQAFYVSLLSAYLAAAYLIGRKLTRFQVLAISFLYSTIMITIAGQIARAIYQALHVRTEIYDAFGDVFGAIPAINWAPVLGNLVSFLAGVVLSLAYMWNARRKKVP